MSPLAEDLIAGKRRALARAITLIESERPEGRSRAEDLLGELLPHTGRSLRLAISGIPGVGKSTFIEAYGLERARAGQKVAVLAIDPSSPLTRGSILGDKTRMEELSHHERAFVRPSPTGRHGGGVQRHTRESILACEAAGYDLILVETVGVGQGEYAASGMVDLFVVLMMPGSGDELQGMKKGILEIADLLVITKADGEFKGAAGRARTQLISALGLSHEGHERTGSVFTVSSTEKTGFTELHDGISRLEKARRDSGAFAGRRRDQGIRWFEDELGEVLRQRLEADPRFQAAIDTRKKSIAGQSTLPTKAARQTIDELLRKGLE